MKVYEVWIGQYEDCERVYSSTNEAAANLQLSKYLIFDESARLCTKEISEEEACEPEFIWVYISTFVDSWEFAKEKGIDHYYGSNHVMFDEWETKCREYHLEGAAFPNEVKGDVESRLGKPVDIDFDFADAVLIKDGCGVGDFGIYVKLDYKKLLTRQKNTPSFWKPDILNNVQYWFEALADQNKGLMQEDYKAYKEGDVKVLTEGEND